MITIPWSHSPTSIDLQGISLNVMDDMWVVQDILCKGPYVGSGFFFFFLVKDILLWVGQYVYSYCVHAYHAQFDFVYNYATIFIDHFTCFSSTSFWCLFQQTRCKSHWSLPSTGEIDYFQRRIGVGESDAENGEEGFLIAFTSILEMPPPPVFNMKILTFH